jgi:hypothetical protein
MNENIKCDRLNCSFIEMNEISHSLLVVNLIKILSKNKNIHKKGKSQYHSSSFVYFKSHPFFELAKNSSSSCLFANTNKWRHVGIEIDLALIPKNFRLVLPTRGRDWWVRVNQWLVFPLTSTDFPLSATPPPLPAFWL